MQVLVVMDKSGYIVAAASQPARSDLASPTIGIAPHPDFEGHVVDLPQELENKPLTELHAELHDSWRVEQHAGMMVLMKK